MLRFFVGIALGAIGSATLANAAGQDTDILKSELAKLAPGIEDKGEDQQILYVVLLVHSGEIEKAVAFRKLIEKKSKSFFIPIAIAQGYLAQKEPSRAASWIFSAAGTLGKASYPLQAQACYLRGISWKTKNEKSDALGSFLEAIKSDPTFAPAYYEWAELIDEKAESITYYAKTLALVQPDSELGKKALTGLLKTLATPKK